jgi:hypothetical protein
VIVDHGQASIRGQVDIALDHVDPDLDRGREGGQGVLGVFGRVAAVAAEEELAGAEAVAHARARVL